MQQIYRYCTAIIFCFFGISLAAQNAPSPTGGGGPLQNPRPNTSNTGGGGNGTCPQHTAASVGESIFIFINLNSEAPTYELPAEIPAFHIAINLLGNINVDETLLFVSPPITSFTYSGESCPETGLLNFYYAEYVLPLAELEEIVAAELENICNDNDFEGISSYFEFQLSTYDNNGDLVEYNIEFAPELFSCVGSQTSYNTNLVDYCCGGYGNIFYLSPPPEDLEEAALRSTINVDVELAYPNPFSNKVYISEQIKKVRILHSSGKELAFYNNFSGSIDTNNLRSGIYVIQFYDGIKWNSKKMIKI